MVVDVIKHMERWCKTMMVLIVILVVVVVAAVMLMMVMVVIMGIQIPIEQWFHRQCLSAHLGCFGCAWKE